MCVCVCVCVRAHIHRLIHQYTSANILYAMFKFK